MPYYVALLHRKLTDHLCTVVACCIAILALFKVPQVSNLWQQLPYLEGQRFGFLILLSAIGWIYLTSLLVIWKSGLSATLAKRFCNRPRIGNAVAMLVRPAEWMTSWLTSIATLALPVSSGLIGVISVSLIGTAGFALVFLFPVNYHWPYLLAGGYVRMIGLWAIVTAGWLGFGLKFGPEQMISGDPQDEPEDPQPENPVLADRKTVWIATGQVLSWLAIVTSLGELLWIAASCGVPLASFRLYSVWAVFHIPVTVIVISALLDFVQQHTKISARLFAGIFLLVLTAFPYVFGSSDVQDPAAEQNDLRVAAGETVQPAPDGEIETGEPSGVDSDRELWLDAFEKRIAGIPPGPVVVIAASGGGSRAALFTSLVIQHLVSSPMNWNPTGAGPSSVSSWSDHILLVSSVSGGSLASGRFLSHPDVAAERQDDLIYTSSEELCSRALRKVNKWIDDAKKSQTDNDAVARELDRLLSVRRDLEAVATDRESASGTTSESAASEAIASRFADEMSMDFMAPILRGALIPNCTRGDCLYFFWEHQFEWKKSTQSRFQPIASSETATVSSSNSNRTNPLVMFNTTDTETGRRVVIGFPKLPPGFLSSSPTFPEEVLKAGSIQNRAQEFGPLSLEDFVEQSPDLSLTRAVRLSSNFPWGFGVEEFSESSVPRIVVSKTAPSVRGAAGRRTLRLLDGGVVDNTGIDSLAALFDSLLLQSMHNPFGREAGIIQSLRERGIVFLEIDSGAKPSGAQSDGSAFEHLLLPLTALNNSLYSNALRISDNLVTQIGINLAISESAAQMSGLPLNTQNQYFSGLSRNQLKGALPLALPATTDVDEPIVTVFPFRFTCNHVQDTNADVMTAFALGPEDKAIVLSMFLAEQQRWSGWIASERGKYVRVREYFTTQDSGAVSQSVSTRLAYRLIDRIQTELKRLQDPAAEWEELPAADRTHRLQRIVTLLLALRSVSDSGSETWAAKNNLWSDLSRLTDAVTTTGNQQLVSQLSFELNARGDVLVANNKTNDNPVDSVPTTSRPAAASDQAGNLNYARLSGILAAVGDAKQKFETELRSAPDSTITGSADTPLNEPGAPQIDSTRLRNNSLPDSPLLRDALRDQSESAMRAIQRGKFYEQKN